MYWIPTCFIVKTRHLTYVDSWTSKCLYFFSYCVLVRFVTPVNHCAVSNPVSSLVLLDSDIWPYESHGLYPFDNRQNGLKLANDYKCTHWYYTRLSRVLIDLWKTNTLLNVINVKSCLFLIISYNVCHESAASIELFFTWVLILLLHEYVRLLWRFVHAALRYARNFRSSEIDYWAYHCACQSRQDYWRQFWFPGKSASWISCFCRFKNFQDRRSNNRESSDWLSRELCVWLISFWMCLWVLLFRVMTGLSARATLTLICNAPSCFESITKERCLIPLDICDDAVGNVVHVSAVWPHKFHIYRIFFWLCDGESLITQYLNSEDLA